MSKGNGTAATVLVVDDDLATQGLAAHVLRKEGYHVLVAADLPQAMDAAAGYEASIELLLTDIMLPSGTGLELATALLTKRPTMPVLYMSGFPADTLRAVQHEGAPEGGFIEKPFTPRTLLDQVQAIVPPHPVAPTRISSTPPPATTIAPSAAAPDAVYRLETPVRCPQCGESISTIRAVRLLREQVNFTSTLPRRGRVLTCPCCLTMLPAELTNF